MQTSFPQGFMVDRLLLVGLVGLGGRELLFEEKKRANKKKRVDALYTLLEHVLLC